LTAHAAPPTVRLLAAHLDMEGARMIRFAFTVGIVALSIPAFAGQEQRGSVEGVVKDTSGAVLPGATIEARSPALVGLATAVTDSQGVYRFPSLAPGLYTVSATLQGFGPAQLEGIRLELGQLLKVDLVLTVAGVTESLQVKAEAPIIDVKQNTAGAVLQSDLIERIPRSRDFATMVTEAPGVDSEFRSRGIQIDGASGADNRFIVDGVDQTDLRFGTLLTINPNGPTNASTGSIASNPNALLINANKSVSPDFIEQTQVKSSGYSAEYRAAIGGVVSAITKSGGNEWHGGGAVYYTNDGLQGVLRPQLRLNPTNQTLAQYFTPPGDTISNWEPVFDVGGPIRRDRVWFYLGYNPQWTTSDRTVTFRDNGQRATFELKPIDQMLKYNITGQLTRNLRAKFAAVNERVRGGYALPGIEADGTSLSKSSLFPTQVRRDSFRDSYSVVADWVPTSKTYGSVTGSYLTYGGQDVGQFNNSLRHTFQASNFQFADIPPGLQQVNGYVDLPSSARQVRDTLSRYDLDADLTRYGTWRGQHAFKAGIQFEHVTNDALSGDQAPTVQLFWDAAYPLPNGQRVRGTYGYYNIEELYTQGNIHANSVGLFVQDAWTLNNRLTLNAGIRAENQDVPSYRPENPGIHFGFGEMVSPRVGFAWDPLGNSRWKIYGSWGMFYDELKLTIGRVMFGADRWVNHYYTLDTGNWPTINCSYPPTNCPGTFITTADFRPIANDPKHNIVDPSLRPTQTEEFTLGVDHELNQTMSVGVRFVRKWADYVIESVCQFEQGVDTLDCGVNNPGFGPIGGRPFLDGPPQPPARRVYDGLEFRFRKRLANRWSMDASYLYSRLWGNWSGVASTDEAVGSLQPNSGLAFNLLYYSFDAAGRPSYGLLATDRPNQFKVLTTYDLPWGTELGLKNFVESGVPLSSVIQELSDGIDFFPYGRGDLGRTPVYSQTDFSVDQRIPIHGRQRLSAGIIVVNLFDQQAAISVYTAPYRDAFNISNAVFFSGFDPRAVATAARVRPDARYGLANSYQPRRSILLQARLTF
jgi:outer membrane receptor protein involved in Fe transport